MSKPRITIVGAGISGLSLAFFLKKSLGDKMALTVFENHSAPGGTIGTVAENGYVEEKGPNGFLDNRPATWELIDAVGLREKIVRADAASRNRFVYHAGHLRKVPMKPSELFTTNLLGFRGKLRLFLEPFIRPRKIPANDETLESLFLRRLGNEAVERLVDPFVSGIYAASAARLSARATFPKPVEYEMKHGSLLKGFFASRKETGGNDNEPELMSFQGGLAMLINALAKNLETELTLNSPVHSVEFRQETSSFALKVEKAGRGDTLHETDIVIIAIPAHAAAKLTSSLDPKLAPILENIPYSPVHVAALGFDEEAFPKKPDGFGYLFSRSERKEVLGCLFSSSIYPGRSPKGKILLRVLIGGSAYPDAAGYPDEKVTELALSNLKRVLGLCKHPEWVRIFRYERAIPQYTIGHFERLERIDKIASRIPGFTLTGNAYRGIGINDCIEESKRLAEKILNTVSQRGIA